MFGRGNGQPPDNPPANEPTEPQGPPSFRLPYLRTWRVRRFKVQADVENTAVELEEIQVTGHGIITADDGSLLFTSFQIDPGFGPQPVPIRGFKSYYDFELVKIHVPEEESRIIH